MHTPTQLTRSAPSRWQGIFAALVTPTRPNETIDYDRLGCFIERLIGAGVHGLIPLGSTGEYYALDAREREQVVKTTIAAAAGRVPVVAGTNAGATADVIAYCRQAEKLGAAGVMLAAPFYSLPTRDELFAHFRAVNDRIGIPIMVYNYPARTGVDMDLEFILRLTTLRRIRYLKESTGEMPRITTLVRRCGDRLGVFCGCDTLGLESLFVGAIGWVGGVVNVIPRTHVELYQAALRQDWATARELFFAMLPTLELMEGGGKYTQFVKAACALAGCPVGPPRRPLLKPTKDELALLRSALGGLVRRES